MGLKKSLGVKEFGKALADTVRRGLLSCKVVKRLIDYRWSSYPVYAYGKKGPEWLKTDLILSYFGGRGGNKAYREKE